MGNITSTTPIELSLSHLPNGVFVHSVAINNSNVASVSINGNTITLTPVTSGSFTVTVNLNTGCNNLGLKAITKIGIVNLPPPPPCEGKINASALYTFNYINSTNNAVVMNSTGWSWQKTSGSATFSTSNLGKNMNFNLSSGSSNFTASRSGCSTKTITFYRNSSRPTLDTNEDLIEVKVIDPYSGRLIKSINNVFGNLLNSEITEDLPFGFYIINKNGISEKYIKIE